MRAFACALLLLEAAGPTWRDGDEATMEILIESCLALGDEAMARAVGLLVTMVEAYAETRHELPFAHLGVLIAAAARDPRDPRLPRLVEQLIEAAAVASGYGADVPRVDWLLDQTRYDSKHKEWRKLAARYLGEPSREDPSLAHLAEIAERLRAQPILTSG